MIKFGASIGASIEQPLLDRRRLLVVAIEEVNIEVFNLLVKCEANLTEDTYISSNYEYPPILSAVKSDSIIIVNKILSMGAEMESSDTYGITPLLAASIIDSVTMFFYLLGRGANCMAQHDGCLLYTSPSPRDS